MSVLNKLCRAFGLSILLIITSVQPLFAYVYNTDSTVDGVGIWLLDGAGGGTSGQPFYGGGTTLVDWRDLEPVKGQYNWGLLKENDPGNWPMIPGTNPPGTPANRFVSWEGYSKRYLCQIHRLGECKDPNLFTDPVEKLKCQNYQRSDCVNPDRFIDHQQIPGWAIGYAASIGRKVRLKIRVTDGALPLWLQGVQTHNGYQGTHGGVGAKEAALDLGPHNNGIFDPYPGSTVCAYKDVYQSAANNPDCHPETDINTAVAYPSYPEAEGQTQPVWWNPHFQEEFKILLQAVSQKVQSDPEVMKGIDFIEASVGNFGEMILYGKSETGWATCSNSPDFHIYHGTDDICLCTQQKIEDNKCPASFLNKNYFCTYEYRKPSANHAPHGVNLWLNTGYSNKKYYDAVMNLLTNYENSFTKIPIAISIGAGLYGGDPSIFNSNCTPIQNDDEGYPYAINRFVIPDAVERWGSRMFLKFAGFGGGRVGNDFRNYCPSQTKCIYETFGSINQWNIEGVTFPFKKPEETDQNAKDRFFRALDGASQDNASILMMWSADFTLISQNSFLLPAVAEEGYLLGPQISVANGQNGVTFDTQTIPAGRNITITTSWTNDTSVSLFDTKEVNSTAIQHGSTINTIKGLPVSYPIYFDLVNSSGNIVFKSTFIPNNGTQNWIKRRNDAVCANGVCTSIDNVFIPWNIPTGTYTPRIGIAINYQKNKFWRLNGLGNSDSKIYSINKPITITSPVTTSFSLRKGWNLVSWPDIDNTLSASILSEVWSSCPVAVKSNLSKTYIYDYTSLPNNFTPGTKIYFNCQKKLN